MMMLVKSKNSQGFTLIEMLVAMSISLILLLGVSQIFSSNKRSQRVTEGLARVQENARFAMKKISIDMRRAGYVGCAGDNLANHLDQTDPAYDEDLFDYTKGTAGWEYTKGLGTSATEPGQTYTLSTVEPGGTEGAAGKWQNDKAEGLPASLVDEVVPGSDIIVMKWMGDKLSNIDLANAVNPKNASIQTSLNHGIAAGTVLVISDCSGGDVFQTVSNPASKSLTRGKAAGGISPGNANPATTDWSHSYPQGANLSAFTSRAYYIGKGTNGEPSLFSITYDQASTAAGVITEEIAEGIENMQVLYGVDTNADKFAEKYVTAEEVTDHSNVVNLKVGLIARSPSDAKTLGSARTMSLLGSTIIIPTDKKLRFAFTTTVKLRNKGAK